MLSLNLMPVVVDELIYKSYEYNRLNNPDIAPERWQLIYSDYEKLEQKFKEKKYLRNYDNTNSQSSITCSE